MRVNSPSADTHGKKKKPNQKTSSQALRSLYAKISGALWTRAFCTGASHRWWRFCVAVAWWSLTWARWAGPPGSGCSLMQDSGTEHRGSARPPICSMGHPHEAEKFTCNVQPCKWPLLCQCANLTFGHSSAWARVAQYGLGGSFLPPRFAHHKNYLA